MQFLKVEIFVIIVVGLDRVQSELNPNGKNVCLRTVNFLDKIMVTNTVPVTRTVKKRCWDIRKFFSCDMTYTSFETRVEPKVVTRSKIVATCCDGYKEEGRDCLPNCDGHCSFGKCVAPYVCDCDIGFYGFWCSKACREGFWGKNCINECNCTENGKCDRISGCICQPGWKGVRCELPCEDGRYGYLCENECTCRNCDHRTGECLTTTTETPTTTTSSPTTTKNEAATAGSSVLKDITRAVTEPIENTVELHSSTDKSAIGSEVSKSETDKMSYLKTDNTTVIGISTTEQSDNYGISDINTETGIGTTEINNYRVTDVDRDSITVTELSTREEEIIGKMDTSSTKTVTSNVWSFTGSAATELTVNFSIKEIFLNETTTLREEVTVKESEVKINLAEAGRGNLPKTTEESVNTEKELTNSTFYLFDASDEENFTKSKPNWKNFTVSKQNLDKSETDNFIFEGKGSSRQEIIFKWLHFLPSLSVASAVSFLIVIIAARWVIVRHRRKTKMSVMVADKNKIHQPEERVKFNPENVFWVNNCTVNPVYLTDVDLNNTTPILETFKPVTAAKGIDSKMKQETS